MASELPARNGARPLSQRRVKLSGAVRRHPWMALGTPLLLVALTLLFVLWVPPLYETTTDIRIDEERSGVAVLEMLQTLSQGSQVATEMAVLQSRTLAEEVVASLALQLRPVAPIRVPRSQLLASVQVDSTAPEATYTLERAGGGRFRLSAELTLPANGSGPFGRARKETVDLGEAVVGTPLSLEGVRVTLGPRAGEEERVVLHVATFADAVEEFQDALVVSRPDREANVVSVRYRGGDPELVQAVANALAETFINRRQGVQSAEARGTVSFLAEQIAALEGQLVSSEEALRDFRELRGIVSIEEEAGAQVRRLAEMQAQRDLMETERRALAQLMTEVQGEASPPPGTPGLAGESPYRRLLAFPSLLRNPATGELLAQLAIIENEVAETLILRSASDRDVVIRLERIRALEAQLQSIAETYLESLGNQVSSIDTTLAAFQGELAQIPAAQMNYLRLGRQAEILSELYTLLQTRLKEAEIVAAVQDQSVRVVDPAAYPRDPVRPRPWLSLFVAVLVGSMMGVGGAVAAEHADRSVRDRADVGRVTGSAVLGLIPELRTASRSPTRFLPVFWNGRGNGGRPRLVERIIAGDVAAEAYRSLRTNLLFSRLDEPPKVVVFTSPMPGDGKSTTAMNLALVLAQQGNRILLVDADMRRGRLHEVLATAREPGLSDLLFGKTTLAEAVRSVQPREGVDLRFIPSGIWPPNPAELIASARMGELLAQARADYDMVILDAPPLNLVTDAALLGIHCDGVVLVVRSGVTEEAPLEFAVEQLQSVRAPLLGIVLNGMEEAQQEYYGSRGRGAYAYFRR